MTRTAIALFTRDLRVHDNPMLRGAADAAEQVLPVFVLDEAILRSSFLAPNRTSFLVDSLRDLDRSLRRLGATGLVVRRGDPAQEVAALAAEVGAASVHVSADWSGHAQRREGRLRAATKGVGAALVVHQDAVAVVPPGTVTPSGKDHFAVFSPYHRRWAEQPRRPVLDPPRRLPSPAVARGDAIPDANELCPGQRAPQRADGGETAGRQRMEVWLATKVEAYVERHNDLAADDTSRLSPYLHFGCLSPTELVASAGGSPGADGFVRQLAWRDFHLQLLAANPRVAHQDYRPRGDQWRYDEEDLVAWQEGCTGYPVVDAALRQMQQEGWMHNRARLIVGSFLAKTLYLDWRLGAAHFMHHLVDGDIANNQLNWQWVAGTGTDSRPSRVLNPVSQGERHDPEGSYVRRYVPELRGVAGPAVHAPWRLPAALRGRLDYPQPVVDLAEGRRRFLAARDG